MYIVIILSLIAISIVATSISYETVDLISHISVHTPLFSVTIYSQRAYDILKSIYKFKYKCVLYKEICVKNSLIFISDINSKAYIYVYIHSIYTYMCAFNNIYKYEYIHRSTTIVISPRLPCYTYLLLAEKRVSRKRSLPLEQVILKEYTYIHTYICMHYTSQAQFNPTDFSYVYSQILKNE